MKKYAIFVFLFAIACTGEQTPTAEPEPVEKETDSVDTTFQKILDASGVHGSILIWRDGTYYSNDFDWAVTGQLPASTFKIPNSMIALELGIMTDDSTLILWDGQPKYLKSWERDLYFREAFHYSCVPCYQEIAREIGVERMKDYMDRLLYGSMKFDSTNLDMFWLEGDSRINQYQQISFLKTFNEQRLPISARTYNIMQRMMVIEENEEYILRGKTGWSVQNNKDNCWFVGFVRTDKEFSYFATNIEPGEDTVMDSLFSIRKAVTFDALKSLGVLKK